MGEPITGGLTSATRERQPRTGAPPSWHARLAASLSGDCQKDKTGSPVGGVGRWIDANSRAARLARVRRSGRLLVPRGSVMFHRRRTDLSADNGDWSGADRRADTGCPSWGDHHIGVVTNDPRQRICVAQSGVLVTTGSSCASRL